MFHTWEQMHNIAAEIADDEVFKGKRDFIVPGSEEHTLWLHCYDLAMQQINDWCRNQLTTH